MKRFIQFFLLFAVIVQAGCVEPVIRRDKPIMARHNVPGYYGNGHDDEMCPDGICYAKDCQESGYYYNGYQENGWRYCVVRKEDLQKEDP